MEADRQRSELQWLLVEICTKLGFCSIPNTVIDSILEQPAFTDDDFVQLCMYHEGLDGDLSGSIDASLKAAFRKKFGPAIERKENA